MLNAILRQTNAKVVSGVKPLASLLESGLDAFFGDSADDDAGDGANSMVVKDGGDPWNSVLPILASATSPKTPEDPNKTQRAMLEVAVKEGYVLVLFLHLRKRRPMCINLREEDVLIATILDWLRHIKYEESMEAKLPLLYVYFFHLCQRQLDYGDKEKLVVKHLLDILDVLTSLAKMGQSWSLLGAIGLGNQYQMTPRARFLVLSLIVFIRRQILPGYRLYFRFRGDELPEEIDPDLAASRRELEALKGHKAYLGLLELIDWVLEKTSDPLNDFTSIHEFIAFLIKDKLYVENYLHIQRNHM